MLSFTNQIAQINYNILLLKKYTRPKFTFEKKNHSKLISQQKKNTFAICKILKSTNLNF